MEPWGWVSCSPPKDVSPTVLVAQISQRRRSHVQPGAGPIAKYLGDQPRSRGEGKLTGCCRIPSRQLGTVAIGRPPRVMFGLML